MFSIEWQCPIDERGYVRGESWKYVSLNGGQRKTYILPGFSLWVFHDGQWTHGRDFLAMARPTLP
jgi:hypothetical protein